MKKLSLLILSMVLLGAPCFVAVADDDVKVEEDILLEEDLWEEDFEDSEFDGKFEDDEFEEYEEEVDIEPAGEPVVEPVDEVVVEEPVEEIIEIEEKPEEELVEEQTPLPPVSQISAKMAWQFIEDELVNSPGYISAFMFPFKGLAAFGGLWALGQHFPGTADVSSGIILRPWLRTLRKKVWSEDGDYSGITTKIILALGALGSYKLAGWGIESVAYGSALKGFLLQYPKINRFKTPVELQPYFDDEYNEFIKGGWRYLCGHAKEISEFVKTAAKMHKEGIKLIV